MHSSKTHLSDPRFNDSFIKKLRIYGIPYFTLTARSVIQYSGTRRELAVNQVKPSFKIPKLEIKPNENAGSLHDTLMNIGSHLVLKTVVSIKNKDVKTLTEKSNKYFLVGENR